MGGGLSLDSSPLPLDSLLAYAPSGRAKPSLYRSNLKAWRFFHTDSPLNVSSAPLSPDGFTSFSKKECYVVLHVYRRQEGTPRASPPAEPPSTPFPPLQSLKSAASLAASSQACLSPRGLSSPFSGYDDCGPYPFEAPGETTLPRLAHDIYIWNGTAALPLTKAVALTKCFELERYLINDGVGAIAHLHAGQGGELTPASSLYAADFLPPRMDEAAGSNHLIALLCHNTEAQSLPCRSLLASMLPSLQEYGPSRFPELSKVLQSYLQPAQPDPPQEDIEPPPPPPLNLPKLGGNGGGGLAVGGAGVPPLGLGVKKPVEAGGGSGEGKTGGGMGGGRMGANGAPKLGLNLAAVDMTQIAPSERELKAEKLAYFNTICSQITESIFLGSDTVARDLKMLQSHGITHVLNAAGTACGNYHEGTLEYKTLYLLDSESEDISTVLFDAVEFIEGATSNGKVYVHCHQGVSRSSSMVIAYLMWNEGLAYNEAFQRVKDIRGVANPNAGFIARLIQFEQRIHNSKPATTPLLYRIAPYYIQPIARLVDAAPPSSSDLDPRTCFVLHLPSSPSPSLFLWTGPRAHTAFHSAALHWCSQLQKFQASPPPTVEASGSESEAFWQALGGRGGGVVKQSKYDGEYGVGTSHLLEPPKPPATPAGLVDLPIRPSAKQVPAPRDDAPSAKLSGFASLPRFNDPLPTPRGQADATDQPLPTPRGKPGGFEEPLPTPRGRPEAFDQPLATPRGGGAGEARRLSAATGGPALKKVKEGMRAELYEHPEWEKLASFSKESLDEEGIFALLLLDGEGGAAHVFFWVGSDSWLSSERDKEILEVAAEFIQSKGLPRETEVSIAHETEEPDSFWTFF